MTSTFRSAALTAAALMTTVTTVAAQPAVPSQSVPALSKTEEAPRGADAYRIEFKVGTREYMEAAIRRFYHLMEALDNKGYLNHEPAFEIFDENLEWELPYFRGHPIKMQGRKNVRAFEERMQGWFRNVKFTIDGMYSDVENHVITVEARSTRVFYPTKAIINNRYVTIWWFNEAGRIVKWHEYTDPNASKLVETYLESGRNPADPAAHR